MEEQLTYYDDDLEPMGQAPRSQVHAQGLLHLVVHCWIVSPRPDGLWVWFQKRSPDKAEFPNYYDIAVGGHVSAGEAPQEAVLREIREEVGLELEPAALEPAELLLELPEPQADRLRIIARLRTRDISLFIFSFPPYSEIRFIILKQTPDHSPAFDRRTASLSGSKD